MAARTSYDIVLFLDILYHHEWDKIYKTVLKKDISPLKNDNVDIILNIEKYRYISEGYKFLVITEPEYPQWILDNVIKPPFVIYYKGDIDTVEKRFIDQVENYDPERGCFLD